jgi:hypothetical protein
MKQFQSKASSGTLLIVGIALILFGVFFTRNVQAIALQVSIANVEAGNY